VSREREEKEFMQSVARRFREARASRALTKNELSQRSGVSRRTITQVESGAYLPNFLTFRRLLIALDVEAAEFFSQ
jgi:transcriptional regulator with XRE-family HTH domain